MVTDLVCKMEVDEKTAFASLSLDGEEYSFCSEGCRAEFMRHPDEYRGRTVLNEPDPSFENGDV